MKRVKEIETLEKTGWKWAERITAMLIAIALAWIVFLAATTVYSADDYWYSTFMDGGVGHYFQMMKEHYLTFNGRMFVHFIAQLILHCGNGMFAVFLVGVCVLIPYTVHKMDAAHKTDWKSDRYRGLICALLFLIGVLTMPRSVLVKGVLWISAFCNYALPTAMIILEIFLLQRITSDREKRFYASDLLIFLYIFLCGATTEQMGAVSIMVAFYFAVKCVIQKTKRGAFCFAALVSGGLGLMTILMSPATQQRFGSEIILDVTQRRGFLPHMTAQVSSQAEFLQENALILCALAVLFLITGCFLSRNKEGRYLIVSILWIMISLVSVAGLSFSEGTLRIVWYVGVVCLLLVQAVMYLTTGYEGLALVQLAGVASAGVMLLTSSGGNRTMLPFFLCILAVASGVLSALLSSVRPPAVVGMLAVISVLSFYAVAVQIPGYWHNYRIDQMNHQSAARSEKTGVVNYCIDYDMSYTHSKIYNNMYYYSKWLEAEKIDTEKCSVYLYGNGLPNVYADGVRSTLPALVGKNGEYLLPLWFVVTALGGTVDTVERVEDLSVNHLKIVLGDTMFDYVSKGDNVTVRWKNAEGDARTIEGETVSDFMDVCISERIFTEAFGFEVREEGGDIFVETGM